MPKEKSAGAIICREEGGRPLYLLLHYPLTKRSKKEYWDFPKGHAEQGETEEQTVRREVQEETGISDLEFIPGFREAINYFFQAEGRKIFKTVVFYFARTRTSQVKISFEHAGFVWLSFEEAMMKLKFKNAKRLLTKAHHLVSRGKSL
ncbi:MAG: NUDIX domain-containing protein [Candidatus Wildermuthbacteria bacterium]|nr:NUDIX domain-containing protein [Candidatus Wildermuthbacteria bacterium]